MAAPTAQEQNFIVDMIGLTAELLDLQVRLSAIRARYNQNTFGSTLVDAKFTDPTVVNTMGHLTQAKLTSAISSIDALLTAFGDNVSGNQVNFIKFQP